MRMFVLRSIAAQIVSALTIVGGLSASVSEAADATFHPQDTVAANDNRRPAGTVSGGTLTLALRAGRGTWRPEGPDGPGLSIEAFGEVSGPLVVPAPLIRVHEGALIKASIRNDLDAPLLIHGLCTRPGASCPVVAVRPHDIAVAEFPAGQTGTYHYWATAFGAPVPIRELAGAFIVDPAGAAATDDRILVITEWSSLTPAQLGRVVNADDPGKAFVALNPGATFVINGLSWPATERLTYRLGEQARWRVINLSSQAHPMHLHGFFFDVESLGDGLRDMPIARQDQHPVVTQLLSPGSTMVMNWTPEREGNWLFHCHIMSHVSLERRIVKPSGPRGGEHAAHEHEEHDRAAGMAGMILGVTVTGTTSAPAPDSIPAPSPRRLTLRLAQGGSGNQPSFGFSVSGDGLPAPTDVISPGPVLLLRRGEPVEISVVNQLAERTALHWHGMELESFYDGVHDWSGTDQRLAPMIEPGGTFLVRFTPPRSGTFIYHTHLHDERQLPLGLYGSLIVVEPGDSYDASIDHSVMLGRSGLDPAAPNVLIPQTPLVINGEKAPAFVWKSATRHRVRLMNITPDDILSVTMQTSKGPIAWTPVAKDGAPLPRHTRTPTPALQTIAVGETYDFEMDLPSGRQTLWLEVRSTTGKWEAQAQVIVR